MSKSTIQSEQSDLFETPQIQLNALKYELKSDLELSEIEKRAPSTKLIKFRELCSFMD